MSGLRAYLPSFLSHFSSTSPPSTSSASSPSPASAMKTKGASSESDENSSGEASLWQKASVAPTSELKIVLKRTPMKEIRSHANKSPSPPRAAASSASPPPKRPKRLSSKDLLSNFNDEEDSEDELQQEKKKNNTPRGRPPKTPRTPKEANYEVITSGNVLDSKRKRRSVCYNMDQLEKEAVSPKEVKGTPKSAVTTPKRTPARGRRQQKSDDSDADDFQEESPRRTPNRTKTPKEEATPGRAKRQQPTPKEQETPKRTPGRPPKSTSKASSAADPPNYEEISPSNCLSGKRQRKSVVSYSLESSPAGAGSGGPPKGGKELTPMRKLALKNVKKAAEQQRNTPQTPGSLQRKKNKKLNLADLENLADELDDESFDPSDDDDDDSTSEEEEDDETTDEEDFCTPKIHRKRGGRTAKYDKLGKASSAPSTPKSRTGTPRSQPSTPKRQMTPRVPKRSKEVPRNLPAIQEAQVRLHVSAVPDSLPCRENEFAEILGFTEGKLAEGGSGCMYISGVPGTGKTATVMEVVRSLKELVKEGELPEFNFVEVNGMRLTEPNQAYVQIYKSMSGGKKVTADHAQSLLDKKFDGQGFPGERSRKNVTTVLLVDELDMLWNRKQSVLYNLFEWPTRATSKLVVLAIANTMDLPERIMMNRVSSRLGLTRLTFAPYTHAQLQQIVAARLQGLEVFDHDAVMLVARKVASLSGDARRALDICRRATEIAQAEEDAKAKKQKHVVVDARHVVRAHEEMFCSPKIMAIRCCSRYEQLFLRAVVFCFEKSGLEETSFERAFEALLEQVVLEGMPRIHSAEGYELMFGLSASGLLLAEHGRLGPHLRIRLNVSTDDVMFALGKEN